MKIDENAKILTVNQRVAGSSPAGGAEDTQALTSKVVGAFFMSVHTVCTQLNLEDLNLHLQNHFCLSNNLDTNIIRKVCK